MNEKPEKKVVSMTVVIALAIIAIVLLVGLIGAMAYYTMTINDKDNQINSINAELASITGKTGTNATETILQLNANITQLRAWLSGNITALQNQYNNYINDHSYTNEQYQNLQSQNTNLNNIINLSDSTTWVNDQTVSQGAGSLSTWTESASYCGYVAVYVQSSTVSGTHVEVTYVSGALSFDQTQVISAGSTAYFPLLPSSSVTVGVGNGNIIGSATETVTITYWY